MMHATLAQEWLHREFFTAPNSTQAADTDRLFMFILWVCIVSFVVLMGAMAYFVVRYRRRPGVPTQISPSHNTAIELAWSIGPLLVLVPIFFWGFHGYIGKQAAPASSEIIRVTGKKWNWSIQYDNGGGPQDFPAIASGTTIPIIYIPAERPIKMIFTSIDVLHAFYIPDFRTKIDVIPNRYTSMWFQALTPTKQKLGPDGEPLWLTKPDGSLDLDAEGNKQPLMNDHYVFCAEYCGDNHSDMWAYIRVLSPSDYAKKKEELTGPPKALKTPAERGGFWATYFGCTSCHQMDPNGPAGSGPPWRDIWMSTREFTNGDSRPVMNDEDLLTYVSQSINNPGSQVVKGYSNAMSNFSGLISVQQVDELAAYIKSLSPKYVPPAQAPAPEGAPAETPAGK